MSYVIAALDIETYSLASNAAIAEVGIIAVDIKEKYAYSNVSPLDPVSTLRKYFPLMEQLVLGRHIDPNTVDFHLKNQGNPQGMNCLFSEMKTKMLPCQETLQLIRDFIATKEVKELWMNHPTFDSGRLHSLAHQVGIKELWPYRIEFDIHTLRKALDLPSDRQTKVAHRGLEDCRWNLSVLKIFGDLRGEKA